MSLAELWFGLVAVLWTGFLVLEGFDFGVGMLHGVVGRDDTGRRLALATVGPVWDGNEVWLVVAGAGMFAAFPGWYATAFSAFYPALVLLLVALILRGVSFEFRGRRDDARWRRTWDTATTAASLAAPLLVGVALGDLLHGVPIGSDQEYTGDLADLLGPYALLTGVTVVLLCLLHGAVFLALRTTGDVHDRAVRTGRRVAPVTVAAVLAFLTWTLAAEGVGVALGVTASAAAVAVLAAWWCVLGTREGLSFLATVLSIAAVVGTIFVGLYPRVMVSTGAAGTDLTIATTSSSSYTLTLMTVVAGVLLPVVLAYQAWSYHVFRQRLGRADLVPARPPRPRTPLDGPGADVRHEPEAT